MSSSRLSRKLAGVFFIKINLAFLAGDRSLTDIEIQEVYLIINFEDNQMDCKSNKYIFKNIVYLKWNKASK